MGQCKVPETVLGTAWHSASSPFWKSRHLGFREICKNSLQLCASSFTFLNLGWLNLTCFSFGCTVRPVRYQFLDKEPNVCHLHWEDRVLATGPPGKSLISAFSIIHLSSLLPSNKHFRSSVFRPGTILALEIQVMGTTDLEPAPSPQAREGWCYMSSYMGAEHSKDKLLA